VSERCVISLTFGMLIGFILVSTFNNIDINKKLDAIQAAQSAQCAEVNHE